MSNGIEFRVLIQGLQLDESARSLIDAAIRSAVLQEIASIDNGGNRRISSPNTDPSTRSFIGLDGTLGLVLQKLSGNILNL